MNKRNLILIAIVGVILVTVIIVLVARGGEDSSTSSKKIERLSEEEKYAMFEAEFVCEFASRASASEEDSGLDISGTIEIIGTLIEKYGYTEQQVAELRVKYENDASFEQLAAKEMRKICPEIAAELEALAE